MAAVAVNWRDTVRDALVGDCPPDNDVEMPDDGRHRAIGLRIMVLSACLYACAVAVVLAHCAG